MLRRCFRHITIGYVQYIILGGGDGNGLGNSKKGRELRRDENTGFHLEGEDRKRRLRKHATMGMVVSLKFAELIWVGRGSGGREKRKKEILVWLHLRWRK